MNLQVLLGNRLVGTLTLLPGEQTLFIFADEYVNDPSRPVLSQSYLLANGQLRQETRPTRTKLSPWFSNLLPEGPLLEYIARKAGINPAREFQLLAFLGNDLPGAVRVIGDGTTTTESESAAIRANKTDGPFRFSLAGIQLKFSALLNERGKLTIPVAGIGGEWIVKLPSSAYPAVPENEAVMLTLASCAGIAVPEHRLVPVDSIEGLPANLGNFAGSQALALRRFDRSSEGERVHMEDLAQVFSVFPHDKYKKVGSVRIAELIGQVLGPEAAQDFVARLTFIVLTGNGDMHLKNWSLLYPDRRTPILSPAYDLISTIPYIPNEGLALNIAGEKTFAGITRDRFRRLAEQAGLPERETLVTVDRVADAVRSAWPRSRQEAQLPEAISKAIDLHLQELPLAQGK
jgi:serine/threonine-protein kinase HipA